MARVDQILATFSMTAGTGAYTGAFTARTGFLAPVAVGNGITSKFTVAACVSATDLTRTGDWEEFEGVYSTTGSGSITRARLIASSTGSAINWANPTTCYIEGPMCAEDLPATIAADSGVVVMTADQSVTGTDTYQDISAGFNFTAAATGRYAVTVQAIGFVNSSGVGYIITNMVVNGSMVTDSELQLVANTGGTNGISSATRTYLIDVAAGHVVKAQVKRKLASGGFTTSALKAGPTGYGVSSFTWERRY